MSTPALLNLTFRSINGEAALRLGVPPQETAASLVRRVRRQLNQDVQSERRLSVFRGGHQLQGPSTLEAIGVLDGDELQLVWRTLPEEPPAWERRPAGVKKRPRVSGAGLSGLSSATKAELGTSDKAVVDLAGVQGLNAAIEPLVGALADGLIEVDLRMCDLSAAQMRAVLTALPASVNVLRLGGNEISDAGIAALARPDARACFRVFDLSYCEFNADDGLDARAAGRTGSNYGLILALLGDGTEEVGFADMSCEPEVIEALAKICPRLRRLDVAHNYDPSSWDNAWAALGACCPCLEELNALHCTSSHVGLRALAAGCPSLRVLVLGSGAGTEGLAALEELGLDLDILAVEVSAPEEVAAAAQLDVGWLAIREIQGTEEALEQLVSAPSAIDAALHQISAAYVELGLPGGDAAALQSLGTRLRVLRASDHQRSPRLPSLVEAACSAQLREFRANLWEQIPPADLATVARACPLLEKVYLNSELGEAQTDHDIDEGVEALGLHCQKLQHLDLYNRRLRTPVRVLAAACRGWPQLRYLCGRVRSIDWSDSAEHLQVAEALAAHCPQLEHLVLYDVPASWKRVLEQHCPVIGYD